MTLDEIRIAPYSLELRRPWRGAAGSITSRRGWLAAAEGGGLSGYGDCSPPPSATAADIAACEAGLRHLAGDVRGLPVETALARVAASGAPAPARCAVEAALLDLQARAVGLPLARLLQPQAAATVLANASLGVLDADSLQRARDAVAAGYTVLKAKVGALPQAEETARLGAIAAELPPGARLRLDANRAWDFGGAQRLVAAVSALPVEALEEPLADPSPAAFQRLQREAPFALALDESLPQWIAAWPGAALEVRRWVLKPMRWGGARRCLALAQEAARAGVESVVTTTVDSAPGCWLAVHLAAALNNGLAHGLGTSEWLAEDLGPAPIPERGEIRVPGPGLGFVPA